MSSSRAIRQTTKGRPCWVPRFSGGAGCLGLETIGGNSKDQVVVDHILGHARDDMASLYRQPIDAARLIDVTESVRKWLRPVGE